jgi:hypothetical protein
MQNDPQIMVWVGIWGDEIIGPYFFTDSVTDETHLQKLHFNGFVIFHYSE